MSFQVSIDEHQLGQFCERWGVAEFQLFGSVLRDDFRADSDVDVAVEFVPGVERSLFDLARMTIELERFFGREVDLAIRNNLRHFVAMEVERTAVTIYGIQRQAAPA